MKLTIVWSDGPRYHAGDLIISDSFRPSHCNTSDLSPAAHARSKNCGCFSGVRCTRESHLIVESRKIADSSGMTSRRNSSHRGADYRSRASNPSIQGAPRPSPGCPGLPVSRFPTVWGVHSVLPLTLRLITTTLRVTAAFSVGPCTAHPAPCIPLDAQDNNTTRAPAGIAFHKFHEMINQECAHG